MDKCILVMTIRLCVVIVRLVRTSKLPVKIKTHSIVTTKDDRNTKP